MKSFMIRSILYASILATYFLGNYLLNSFLISLYPPKINFTTLIMGDSHVMTGLDPSKFINARNISQSGEPYVSTYFKLRKLVESNHFDTLILGFAPHNLSQFNDTKFNLGNGSDEAFLKMYPITSINDYRLLEINPYSYLRVIVKNMMLFPRKNHKYYLGNFIGKNVLLKNSKYKPQATINRHYYHSNKQYGVSRLCLNYLDSIIHLCSKYKIRPILVNMPLHQSYQRLIPKNITDGFIHEANLLEKVGITIVDLSNYPLPDSCFADYDHLNFRGAEVISKKLIRNFKTSKL